MAGGNPRREETGTLRKKCFRSFSDGSKNRRHPRPSGDEATAAKKTGTPKKKGGL